MIGYENGSGDLIGTLIMVERNLHGVRDRTHCHWKLTGEDYNNSGRWYLLTGVANNGVWISDYGTHNSTRYMVGIGREDDDLGCVVDVSHFIASSLTPIVMLKKPQIVQKVIPELSSLMNTYVDGLCVFYDRPSRSYLIGWEDEVHYVEWKLSQ